MAGSSLASARLPVVAGCPISADVHDGVYYKTFYSIGRPSDSLVDTMIMILENINEWLES